MAGFTCKIFSQESNIRLCYDGVAEMFGRGQNIVARPGLRNRFHMSYSRCRPLCMFAYVFDAAVGET